MNGDGFLFLLVAIGGGALLGLYGVPALILLFTKRHNRLAAKLALGWTLFPTVLFLCVRIAGRNDVQHLLGEQGSILLLLIFAPTALIDWWAWSRLESDEPAPAPAPSESRSGPAVIVNLVPLWGAIQLLHALYNSFTFWLLVTVFPSGNLRAALLCAGALGWLVVSLPQWLLLRRVGIGPRWMASTCAAGVGAALLTQLVYGALGSALGRHWSYPATATISGAMIAAAQWWCIPERFVKRGLWLLALPGAQLVVAVVSTAAGITAVRQGVASNVIHALGATAIGLVTGAAMQQILASSQAPDGQEQR